MNASMVERVSVLILFIGLQLLSLAGEMHNWELLIVLGDRNHVRQLGCKPFILLVGVLVLHTHLDSSPWPGIGSLEWWPQSKNFISFDGNDLWLLASRLIARLSSWHFRGLH
jgi:hypothetical protein